MTGNRSAWYDLQQREYTTWSSLLRIFALNLEADSVANRNTFLASSVNQAALFSSHSTIAPSYNVPALPTSWTRPSFRIATCHPPRP
ncbi:hypothetical protein RSOLAG1IB_04718 [Rhizoctonia solani AG-1 IB]|uniref:Uncharacterized protein n=1 Tax=Thanatephorus cucumeris (strain AG1-IB / isolate 7/3/14) TaxID=1108050 RepID=A0A0B7G0E1_THACB|nr:hypothetical protein RSOLAG1IB_04718 [Rhizoctonia solani AG-1 IB]